MSSDLRINYRPHLDATPEAELEMLAAVYSFLIQRHVNRNAAASGGCADNKGGENNQSKAPSGSGGLRLRIVEKMTPINRVNEGRR
jgi:hypothetical protein